MFPFHSVHIGVETGHCGFAPSVLHKNPPGESLTFSRLADKLCALDIVLDIVLEKSNLMKGGARPMLMNKFQLTPAFIGKADFDSRSAPASR